MTKTPTAETANMLKTAEAITKILTTAPQMVDVSDKPLTAEALMTAALVVMEMSNVSESMRLEYFWTCNKNAKMFAKAYIEVLAIGSKGYNPDG